MLPAQRSFRFLEEALELAQASGTSREDALRLVDYVYSRPSGDIRQEIGGVMVALSALATSFGLSMYNAGETELRRCQENTEKIRAKDLTKPERSPLPVFKNPIANREPAYEKIRQRCLAVTGLAPSFPNASLERLVASVSRYSSHQSLETIALEMARHIDSLQEKPTE